MKYVKMTVSSIVAVSISSVLLLAPTFGSADEPVSTITPSEDQYILYGNPAGITLTTSETPTPACPGDIAVAPPDYFWDCGPLDGTNNGDGTAFIATDVDGDYEVNVYCSQEFVSSITNTSYSEQTQSSN